MSEKYQGKYRSESARLQKWDYGWNATNFITICTKDRIHFFGEIENKKMKLSQQGVIKDLLWYEIKNHANRSTTVSKLRQKQHIINHRVI